MIIRRKRPMGREYTQPYYKKKRTGRGAQRYQGLNPSYRGFSVRRFQLGEWKYVDNSNAKDINSTPSFTLLNGIASGVGASQRVGQKVAVRSLEIRAQAWVTATTGVTNMCRAIIVQDRQANAEVIGSITDVLQANNSMSPRSLPNRKRFKILWDKFFLVGGVLNGAGTGSNIPEQKLFKSYIKFKRPIFTDFNAGEDALIGSITSNAIYLVLLGNIAAGATDANLTYYIRVRYTDM